MQYAGVSSDVGNQYSDDAEYIDDIVVWQAEVREVGLIFGNEGEAFSVVHNLPEEHTL